MPVPNSTELHHTQANIHHAAAQEDSCVLARLSAEEFGPGTTS